MLGLIILTIFALPVLVILECAKRTSNQWGSGRPGGVRKHRRKHRWP